MDVSNRAGASPRTARSGVREALLCAAWFAPLLLPLAVAEFALVAHPWLSSLEADPDRLLLPLREDVGARAALATFLVAAGGPRMAVVIALLLVPTWLALARWRGVLRRGRRPPLAVNRRAVLVAILIGGLAVLLVQWSSLGLQLVVDAVTGLRPTAPESLALLFGAEALGLVGCGACLGATVALAREAGGTRARNGALAVLAVLASGFSLLHGVSAAAAIARFDVGVELREFAGEDAPAADVLTVSILARDRSWARPIAGGIAGVRFDADVARRLEAHVAQRRGWTMLGAGGERLIVGERLVALDPGGARAAALRCVERRATPQAAHALLASLLSSAGSAETRATLARLDEPWVRPGPFGLHLLAAAWANQGDRARAEALLAPLRAQGGEAFLVSVHGGRALRLAELTTGRISGRLVVDGVPHAGRIGVVRVADAFDLTPPGTMMATTWLLRLAAVADCDATGAFRFDGLGEDEHALVVLGAAGSRALAQEAPLPRLEPSRASPEIDAGEIRLMSAVATSG